jgi:HlyD family type I secretion membrane fusion protein
MEPPPGPPTVPPPGGPPAAFLPAPAALPAAPPRPPVGRFIAAGLLVVALLFGGFGGWASLAPLASAAIAMGTVRAESSRKTVQHLEGGIIAELLVREGDRVAAGQPLIRLDATAAQSRYEAIRHERDLALASQARLRAEQARAARLVFPEALEARRHEPRIATLLANQEQIFATRRQSYEGQREILTKRIEQLRAQIEGFRAQIAAAERQLGLIDKEQRTVADLVAKGLERQPRLLDLQRRGAALEGAKAESAAEIARAEQAIGETELRILALDDEQSEKVAGELEKVQASLARLEEELTAAADVLRRRVITAPLAGTVVNLHFVTPGGVISPGTPILDIVPAEDRLLIEAQVNPLDIDVVRPGLLTEVRLTAYKQRLTPVLDGRLVQVSADRFVDERTGVAYYKALVEVPASELARAGDVALYPGMPTEVMIKTGERTFLDYLLQPIRDSFARAFTEQ